MCPGILQVGQGRLVIEIKVSALNGSCENSDLAARIPSDRTSDSPL